MPKTGEPPMSGGDVDIRVEPKFTTAAVDGETQAVIWPVADRWYSAIAGQAPVEHATQDAAYAALFNGIGVRVSQR